jgi:SMC interacting uncharacterized protein involved in chromosome segregation
MENSSKAQEYADQINNCKAQMMNLEDDIRALEKRLDNLRYGGQDIANKRMRFEATMESERMNLKNISSIANMKMGACQKLGLTKSGCRDLSRVVLKKFQKANI